MNILRNIKVPTGNILIVSGENGKLECLSIGDYGKDAHTMWLFNKGEMRI